MSNEHVQWWMEEAVGWISINRPQVLNAIARQTAEEFLEAVAQCRQWAAENKVRVVVITGGGERAFSAGADLKERHDAALEERWSCRSISARSFSELEALPVPVIGAVNGLAVGAGCELLLCCDLRIAAETAWFALPETRLGILPGAGGTQRLTRLIGPGQAKWMILTGRRISATEALRVGLVHEVVAAPALKETAQRLALEIATSSPLGLAGAKQMVSQAMNVDLQSGLQHEEAVLWRLFHSEDYSEALHAFAEKRPPQFSGR